MARLVTLVVSALILALPFLMPGADPARLAGLEAYRILTEVTVPAEGDEEAPTVGDVLLDSSACTIFEGEREGEAQFVLFGAGLRDVPLGHPSALDLRRSITRGLRQVAGDRGLSLEVVGENMPAQGGASFELLVLKEDALKLVVRGIDSLPDSEYELAWEIPRRTSLLPPLVAIAIAVIFRRPIAALFLGVLAGSVLFVVRGGAGVGGGLVTGALRVVDTYFWHELVDRERYMIVLFVVFMLAMVGVMTRSGGIRGVMDSIARVANSVRSTQVSTYLMGLVIFFDDYANTILVGSTMRPLTDRFKVAREKLAYIVDSTAAPVAGLAIFSTWIAFQVSTFSAQLPAANLAPSEGYRVVVDTLPYRFYCIFTLLFVGMVVVSGRDFGPMRKAEQRARRGDGLVGAGAKPMVSAEATAMEPAAGIVPRAHRAIVPIAAFIAVSLGWIVYKGSAALPADMPLWSAEGLRQVLYEGSGSEPLMLGSLVGLVLAGLLGAVAGMRGDIVRAALTTLKSMGVAIAILYLAWMIGAVCADLGTAPFLTALLGESLEPQLLPVLVFLLGGAVAFSTGSSWSTMSILLPLVVGLAFNLGQMSDLGGYLMMVVCIGAVFEGAIFGDHCSPISDTTVMSSIASASDHIDHVRTQAPYAITTMAVAMLAGYLPATFFGWSPWMSLGVGSLMLAGILVVVGRPTRST